MRRALTIASATAAVTALTLIPAAAATAATEDGWYVTTWSSPIGLVEFDKTGAAPSSFALSPTVPERGSLDIIPGTTTGVHVEFDSPAEMWTVDLDTGGFTYVAPLTASAIAAEWVTAFDIDPDGTAWISGDSLDGSYSRYFGRVDLDTGEITVLAAPPARLTSLASDPSGTLYAVTYSGDVWTYDAVGDAFVDAGENIGSGFRALDYDPSLGLFVGRAYGGNWTSWEPGVGTTALTAVDNENVPAESFAVATGLVADDDDAEVEDSTDEVEPELAETGVEAGVALGGAALLLALGGAAVAVAQRRRSEV